MTKDTYPMSNWVTTIGFEHLLHDGFERLHRQEALRILVDVNGGAA